MLRKSIKKTSRTVEADCDGDETSDENSTSSCRNYVLVPIQIPALLYRVQGDKK